MQSDTDGDTDRPHEMRDVRSRAIVGSQRSELQPSASLSSSSLADLAVATPAERRGEEG